MKNFYKLVIFSLLLWGALPLGAAELVEPRLVVNIIIDGLRNDYISRFESNIGKTGIKRLQNGGTTFRSASYDFAQTNASAGLATIVVLFFDQDFRTGTVDGCTIAKMHMSEEQTEDDTGCKPGPVWQVLEEDFVKIEFLFG